MYNINPKAAGKDLAPSLLRLLNFSDQHDLVLKATYIIGEHNTSADKLSRLKRSGDYQLDPGLFNRACHCLHFYPKVDMFASKQNHLLPHWCGLRAPVRDKQDSTYLGNAFSLNWSSFGDRKLFLHPPIPLIYKVLKKFKQEATSRGMFVAPDWQGQYWSPLLKELTDRKIVINIKGDALFPNPRMKKRMKGDKGALLLQRKVAVYIPKNHHPFKRYNKDGQDFYNYLIRTPNLDYPESNNLSEEGEKSDSISSNIHSDPLDQTD
jgi:hypothetical protein